MKIPPRPFKSERCTTELGLEGSMAKVVFAKSRKHDFSGVMKRGSE